MPLSELRISFGIGGADMLRFLFGTKPSTPVKVETQRETFDRLVSELNEALEALPIKPKVTIDPATGHVAFETPEHFPDEALALPAPTADEAQAPKSEEPAETGTAEADQVKEKAA